MAKAKKKLGPATIVVNKKARFDYTLHEKFEAGIELQGWEVKALRAGRAQLVDAYVLVQNGECYLVGLTITPLESASSHVVAQPGRSRKLLLHKKEIARIFGATSQKGQTCVGRSLYWKGHNIKCEIALATGKKTHDKRAAIKERDWNRDKARVMKDHA